MAATANNHEKLRCLMSQYNFLQKLFFWWLKDIVCKITRHDFEVAYLRHHKLTENLSEKLANTLERSWREEQKNALSKKRRASLWSAIVKTYYRDFLKFAIFAACSCIILILQPQLLKLIMSYFDSDTEMSTLRAYVVATIFVILMLVNVALDCHSEFQLVQLGTRAKIASSSLIYRKMLRLPSPAAHRRPPAHAVMDLLAVDVEKFECLFYCIPYIVMLPLQLLITFYLIWQTVGSVPATLGTALLIFQTLPIKVLYYKISPKLRAKLSVKTNERICLIDELVNGIRAVKLNVWELYFEQLVHRARRSEIANFLKISYLTSAMWVLAVFSHRFCTFVVAALYISQYGFIEAAQILPINLHFFNLRSNFIYFFFGARTFVDMHASVKRIEEFLMLQEVAAVSKYEGFSNEIDNVMISMRNMTASWDANLQSFEQTLENIDVDFLAKKLYAIVGMLGSGKSSLLKSILKELPATQGEVIVRGRISFASQEPWLLSISSIRDNIIFGEIYDEEKYDRVVKACALLDDINELPDGDETVVGHRNIQLTASQSAKINVARAVYREADIYLFDDPLSLLDQVGGCNTNLAKEIIDNCILGILKDKTRLFVTQNVKQLGNVDEILLLEHGVIKFQGSAAEFRKNDEYLEFSVDHRVASHLQHHNERSVDEMEATVEDSEIDDEENVEATNNEKAETNENVEPNECDNFIATSAKKQSSIYRLQYVQAGSFVLLAVLIAFNLVFVLSAAAFDFQLASWGQADNAILKKSLNQSSCQSPVESSYSDNVRHPIWILASLIVLLVLSAIGKNVLLYQFVFKANQTIHNNAFSCLIRAPLLFFQVNPSERILNLFSKITDNLDNGLSQSLFESLQTATHAVAILLPIYIIDWRHIFPTILSLYFYIKISRIYVSCVHTIKEFVAKAKHPVLSFVLSSLQGLTTIRAYKAENTARKNFDSLQDRHTIVHFLAVALVQAFSFWMYLISIGLFALTLFASIALKQSQSSVSANYVGLALMQLLSVSFLMASVVGYIVETTSSTTSLRRMLQFTFHLAREIRVETARSCAFYPSTWPDKGQIEFRQLHLRYSEDDDKLALTNLSFVIQAGSKVNIVGPSGAGKSSVTAALARLAKFDGDLLIDGVDIKQVQLDDLRSRLSIISKEPILFATSLRNNLDPSNEFDDAALWSALDEVELKHKFRSLEYRIEPAQASNWSSRSQRYLLCLARAILKRNRILVLDEVIDDVDSDAKLLIHHIIRTKFQECTVLVMSRQIDSAMASERTLRMEGGELVADGPHHHSHCNNN